LVELLYKNNTTGCFNTASGQSSGFNINTGICNSFFGMNTGYEVTTGSNNLLLGINAGRSTSPFEVTTQSDRIVLGDNDITNAYVKVAWTVTSDLRDKMNIESVPHGLDFVNQLNPIKYNFKKSRDGETPHGSARYGFSAQDILALEGDNPVIIDNENEDSLKYNGEALVPVLVNAIKELKSQNEDLKSRIEVLENK
jgi:trimeric autotransporter adhesin